MRLPLTSAGGRCSHSGSRASCRARPSVSPLDQNFYRKIERIAHGRRCLRDGCSGGTSFVRAWAGRHGRSDGRRRNIRALIVHCRKAMGKASFLEPDAYTLCSGCEVCLPAYTGAHAACRKVDSVRLPEFFMPISLQSLGANTRRTRRNQPSYRAEI